MITLRLLLRLLVLVTTACTHLNAVIKNPLAFINFFREKPEDFYALSVQENQRMLELFKKAHGDPEKIAAIVGSSPLPAVSLFRCDSETCPLSERNALELRKQFSELVSFHVLEKQTAKWRDESASPVEYVSFASGELLQDFSTFIEVFLRIPNARINATLIDPKYAPIVLYQTLFNTFVGTDEEKKQFRKTMIANKCYPIAYTVLQFVRLIKELFPESQLTIELFPDAQSYLSQLDIAKYPEVISAIDIEDIHDGALAQKSLADFETLCCETSERTKSRCRVTFADKKSRQIFESPTITIDSTKQKTIMWQTR